MRTISLRDLRQRWPEVEAWLRVEKEIVITRNAKPVARLVHVDDAAKVRRRFDPVARGRWQREIAGGKITRGGSRCERRAVGSRLIYLGTSCQFDPTRNEPK